MMARLLWTTMETIQNDSEYFFYNNETYSHHADADNNQNSVKGKVGKDSSRVKVGLELSRHSCFPGA